MLVYKVNKRHLEALYFWNSKWGYRKGPKMTSRDHLISQRTVKENHVLGQGLQTFSIKVQ